MGKVVQILLLISLALSPFGQPTNSDYVKVSRSVLESAARSFLRDEGDLLQKECTKIVNINWAYNTNITDHNKEALVKAKLKYAALQKSSWSRFQTWSQYKTVFTDEDITRQFKTMAVLGSSALPEMEFAKYTRLVSDMMTLYSTTKLCSYDDPKKCDLSLDRELDEILSTSRNNEELLHVWKSWRDNTGKRLRSNYKKFVPLANKAAQANGFANMGDMDIEAYETETFRDDIAGLWEQLKPLYMQLHAYTRRKLREVYGNEIISERGPIPAHLLGNMWAQQWELNDLLLPYPHKQSIDVTEEMIKQGYTSKKMFELSEEFFTSLNLTAMPKSFWDHSLLDKPEDRQVNCHASAFDFCNGKDFRIKQCTNVGMKDLITAHHEMGHIQYYLQYKNQPYYFRSGANPGFHEALGDTLALSVATPKHLHKIGLLDTVQDDPEADINFLLEMALRKVAFLPFAYSMDLWRWRVFDGTYSEKDWNCGWWDLRYGIQGVKPGVTRTENYFDPAAKFHIANNRPYIGYFVSFIIQFQFHKALCLKAGEYDPEDPNKPLHKCDIYQSIEAGNALGDMLQLGSSRPWGEAMAALTGEEKMDASVLREYFKPLEKWLKKNNKEHGEFIGWRPDGEYCVYQNPQPKTSDCKTRQERSNTN